MKRAIRLIIIVNVLALLFTATPFTSCAASVYDAFEYRSYTYTDLKSGQTTLPYRLYVPETYSSEKQYPLVIFLHGAGSRGTDNTLQLTGSGLAYMLDFGYDDCIIIAPQCPEESQWVLTPWADGAYSTDDVEISPQLAAFMEVLANVCNEYSVDFSRIYLTGLSMGGFGTWDLITRYPDVFAAAVPICGSGDPSKAKLLADSQTKIWTFHGTADPVVPYEGTASTVEAVINAGGDIKFTPYEGMKHDTWTITYKSPEVYEWMFAQKLENTEAAESILKPIKQSEAEKNQPTSGTVTPTSPEPDGSPEAPQLKPIPTAMYILLPTCAVLLILTIILTHLIKKK